MTGQDDIAAFCTRPAIARRCVRTLRRVCAARKIPLRKMHWLEPSGGAGAFLPFFPPQRTAIDIHPRHPEIRRQDFLAADYSPPPGRVAVVGNPPFGRWGNTALQFINRSCEFADVVAFILPTALGTFEHHDKAKVGALRVDARFSRVHRERLPAGSFEALRGGGQEISAEFQIWDNAEPVLPRVRIPFPDILDMVDLRGFRGQPATFQRGDLFVVSTFYKNNFRTLTRVEDIGTLQTIRIRPRKNIREVRRIILAADWTRHCHQGTAGSRRHICKRHVIRALAEGLGHTVNIADN